MNQNSSVDFSDANTLKKLNQIFTINCNLTPTAFTIYLKDSFQIKLCCAVIHKQITLMR